MHGDPIFFLLNLFFLLLTVQPGLLHPSSLTRNGTHATYIRRWNLNHWTTREVPSCVFFFFFLICLSPFNPLSDPIQKNYLEIKHEKPQRKNKTTSKRKLEEPSSLKAARLPPRGAEALAHGSPSRAASKSWCEGEATLEARSLVGCSPWGHKESDVTQRLNNNSRGW